VKRHPNAKASNRNPIVIAHGALCRDRGLNGVGRARKRSAKRVSYCFEYGTVAAAYDGTHDLVVLAYGDLHSLAMRVPPFRASFDVRKHEGHRAGGNRVTCV
jgi:hypothetical protein